MSAEMSSSRFQRVAATATAEEKPTSGLARHEGADTLLCMWIDPRPRRGRFLPPLLLAVACNTVVVATSTGPALAQGGASAGKGVTSLIQKGGELFDDQQYEESIQTLSAALMRPGTQKSDKIEIYRLLAYNYITLKRTEEADAAVRGLYVVDESFTLPKS